MPRSLPELDREVTRLAHDLAEHKGQFALLRGDINNVGARLEAKIEATVSGIQLQINPLIKARVQEESFAEGVAAQLAKEDKCKVPNPWLLAAWPPMVTLLVGFMLAWAARDHLQGGLGTGVQSVTTTSTETAPQHP
jgi:hypothetical protein